MYQAELANWSSLFMVERKQAPQWGWEPLVRGHNWDEVENWWESQYLQNPKDTNPLKSLLAELRRIVPVISVVDGMEALERHILCNDPKELWADKEHLKGAAKILQLGELQAAVEGEPENALDLWNEHRTMVEEQLSELSSGPEDVVGTAELSRATHAREASELLRQIDNTTEWMCAEFESEIDPEWFRETAAEIAFAAFVAGRHTQEAWAKEFEHRAAARIRSLRAFAEQNEGRTAINLKRRQNRIAREMHAERVAETRTNRTLTKSALAEYILRNWNKIGEDGERPTAPAKQTIQNWFSEKSKKVSRTRSSSG